MRTNIAAKKTILVVGGAGYIGSHMAHMLKQNNYTVIILDNLSTGHKHIVEDFEFIQGDINDSSCLDHIFMRLNIDAVMHFAAFINVGESVLDPAKYYFNNVAGTINLLAAMQRFRIQNFIFSSTAAVYGNAQYVPIDEDHPIAPLNPYGKSKRMVEEVIFDFASAYKMKYFILRYFNASGRDPKNPLLGECHTPETHLIPLILKAAKDNVEFKINGNDYDTKDGTCVRDYIHVSDICRAHMLALECLFQGGESNIVNLGTGKGHSILEVIHMAEEITDSKIATKFGARRQGDPDVLVANPDLANNILAWLPEFSDLKKIIKDNWMFESIL